MTKQKQSELLTKATKRLKKILDSYTWLYERRTEVNVSLSVGEFDEWYHENVPQKIQSGITGTLLDYIREQDKLDTPSRIVTFILSD